MKKYKVISEFMAFKKGNTLDSSPGQWINRSAQILLYCGDVNFTLSPSDLVAFIALGYLREIFPNEITETPTSTTSTEEGVFIQVEHKATT